MIGRRHHIIIDTADPAGLAAFYSELFGLPVTYRSEDFVVVSENDRTSGYAFQLAPDHRAPQWPDPDRPQQVHLDIMVDDLGVADRAVRALGARPLPPGDHVYADPSGHPFCLIRRPAGAPAAPAVPDAAFARDPATDPATASYYAQRAAEYDEWYLGEGTFAGRDRPGWDAERDRVVELVSALPAARTLDVACGSGFLTRHLRGLVVGIDQSRAMVTLTQSRLPDGLALTGDALDLPFADQSFDRTLTGHFYGHLSAGERRDFLAEARRVAAELIVVDSALRPGGESEQWQERVLNDGSRHRVYKRYLSGQQLAQEIGGEVLLAGTWFVVARTRW